MIQIIIILQTVLILVLIHSNDKSVNEKETPILIPKAWAKNYQPYFIKKNDPYWDKDELDAKILVFLHKSKIKM